MTPPTITLAMHNAILKSALLMAELYERCEFSGYNYDIGKPVETLEKQGLRFNDDGNLEALFPEGGWQPVKEMKYPKNVKKEATLAIFPRRTFKSDCPPLSQEPNTYNAKIIAVAMRRGGRDGLSLHIRGAYVSQGSGRLFHENIKKLVSPQGEVITL